MPISRIYRIETERLVIRCYQPADAPMLLNAITVSLEHLRPWMPWTADEPTDLRTKVNLLRKFRGNFDLGIDYCFGIFSRDEKELIGSTGLHTRLGPTAREIGYWISALHLNQGYATEAVGALTRAGLDLENLSWLEIHCDPTNTRSQHVAQKLGYRPTKTNLIRAGNPAATMVWTLFRNDFEKGPIRSRPFQAFDILGAPL